MDLWGRGRDSPLPRQGQRQTVLVCNSQTDSHNPLQLFDAFWVSACCTKVRMKLSRLVSP